MTKTVLRLYAAAESNHPHLLLLRYVFDSIGQVQRSDNLLVRSIFDQVLAHGEAHENLRVLCKDIGHRLSGSLAPIKPFNGASKP